MHLNTVSVNFARTRNSIVDKIPRLCDVDKPSQILKLPISHFAIPTVIPSYIGYRTVTDFSPNAYRFQRMLSHVAPIVNILPARRYWRKAIVSLRHRHVRRVFYVFGSERTIRFPPSLKILSLSFSLTSVRGFNSLR